MVNLGVSYSDTWSRNVVAEKTGSELSGGIVIIGAGYSDIFAQTSSDRIEHTGLVTLMTVARAVAQKEYPFTVIFALWGASDYPSDSVMQGDEHFVSEMSESQKANMIAVVKFDDVAFRSPLYVAGEDPLKGLVLSAAAEAGVEIVSGISLSPEFYSDKPLTFQGNGIPYASLWASKVGPHPIQQNPSWLVHLKQIGGLVDTVVLLLVHHADTVNESSLGSSQNTDTPSTGKQSAKWSTLPCPDPQPQFGGQRV